MRRPSGPWRALLGVVAVLILALLAASGGASGDFSAGQTFTLSDETHAFLDNLDRPVQIEVFFAEGQPGYGRVVDLIDRFRSESDAVAVTYRDPDGERAIDLGVVSGAVAVSAEDEAPVVVRTPNEADLVELIGRATGRTTPTVTAHRAPGQPLLPTPLGRRLLWLLPAVVAPLAAAATGLTITARRRRF